MNTGWQSGNETRAFEDMNPVEGLDEYRRPLNMAAVGEGGDAPSAREIAEMVQKVYLGVGVVITADEARDLLRRAGAVLPGSLPVTESAGLTA